MLSLQDSDFSIKSEDLSQDSQDSQDVSDTSDNSQQSTKSAPFTRPPPFVRPPPPQPPPPLSFKNSIQLVRKARKLLGTSTDVLHEAREIAESAGLTVDVSILNGIYQSPFLNPTTNIESYAPNCETPSTLSAFAPILSTTGGHSNTDHIVQYTGNKNADKHAAYKRALIQRARAQQPEELSTFRWDQPRAIGTRRRRIIRERDLPTAPSEPPHSGYIVFIGQLTTKVRHDRPKVRHNQIDVIKEVSQIWRYGMSKADRAYYTKFAKEAKKEYECQHREFRATGVFPANTIVKRLHEKGPWVLIDPDKRNKLEHEICGYDTVVFPPRPESVPEPPWVRKIELATERENVRREKREKIKERKREEEWRKLQEVKMGGLQYRIGDKAGWVKVRFGVNRQQIRSSSASSIAAKQQGFLPMVS